MTSQYGTSHLILTTIPHHGSLVNPFRVGLSAGFLNPDATPLYPDFDLTPLTSDPRTELVKLQNASAIAPRDAADLDALILLGETFLRDSIDAGGRLALIARFGVGYDTVDVEACTRNAVAVAITPDGVRRPVAVSVIALLLALTGRMFDKDRLTRLGPAGFAQRSAYMGTGLVGRTFGLVGIGNIGAETVRLAKPFDMRIVAHDPYADPVVVRDLGIGMVELDELFRISDFVSLNCPLNAETHHLVDARRIALMKPTAFLINTARGPIVDQRALTAALAARRIAGAGLDVFDPEPPAPDDPLLTLDNVILAPHALCHTDQCFAGIGASCVAAALAVRDGRAPQALVNPAVIDDPKFKAKLAGYKDRHPEVPERSEGLEG
jgi:phosphoglycerate dehydrogenase-like enzyme